MPKVHEGQLDAGDRYFGIAVSRFNDLVTTRLLDGALDCIQRHGGKKERLPLRPPLLGPPTGPSPHHRCPPVMAEEAGGGRCKGHQSHSDAYVISLS